MMGPLKLVHVLLGGPCGVYCGGAHRRRDAGRVIASNSRSRAVMELKIDELARRVEKHNCLIERTYKLEQDMAVVRRDVDALEERSGR